MPRPHGGRWCFLTWINVHQVLRQQVCVVVGSALRSEWLLRARGRCRARASVGGTSGWSSLEFLHTITIVCVFVHACCLWGTGFAYTLWAPRLPHKHEESSSCHDYRVCFRLNIMLFSYDNICFCIALLLFVKISEDLQDLNNF